MNKKTTAIITLSICITLTALNLASCKKIDDDSSSIASSIISSSSDNSSENSSNENNSNQSSSSENNSDESSSSENNSSNESSSNADETVAPLDKKEVKPLSEEDVEELNELNNEIIIWGPGIRVDKNNRPETLDNFDKSYNKYGGIFSTDKSEKNITLTFDLGYENGYTAKILDTLKEKDVQGIFFVTGPYARGQKDLIKRIIDEGHILGSHTVNHPAMPTISIKECENEILELHNYIKEEYNYDMWLIRPPEGKFSIRTLSLANKLGYKTVLWSFAYADWDAKKQPDPAAALEKITKSGHNGGLYLLHAVSKTNCEIMGRIIDKFTEDGYTLSPLYVK